MNSFFDIDDLYLNILPDKRKNNERHLGMASNLKTHLKKCEEELISNLNSKQIKYTRNYLKNEQIQFCKAEEDFLKEKLYGEWFYKSSYYNKLILQSDNCCYCFIGSVDELDHFFNKNDNPELSVSNVNLVPTCTKCNKKKTQDAIYLHPYYEDIYTFDWLQCNFDWEGFEGKPIPIFSIVKPSSMTHGMYAKLNLQLPKTKVIKEMTEKSSDYISSHWNSWKIQVNKMDEESFRMIIYAEYEGQRDIYGINTWENKTYQALYESFDNFYEKLRE